MKLHTPVDSKELGAVALFSLGNWPAEELDQALRKQFGIKARSRRQSDLSGVRVSPHLYTSKAELDRFVTALRTLAKQTPPRPSRA